ncbi:phosphoenolpyruvate carboxylase [Candidatus Micrarchaeota archaeon]|nr:phosphoenolpyruvate carboxylase [Candidatus Micrarchaeota archaeon]MBU1939641.1 phosphoenolpyruvate carboxylase [Candidatus Micrarchaeota archaeon]
MSTQHPDNVHPPFFATNGRMGGEDEIQEAYYAFSYLDCDEQMWDCEGKEVDNFVVKKLLGRYEFYFNKTQLGEDKFITLRVPNPEVEKAEAKILLETLESIPRSFDSAKLFYGKDVAPIFEVILPMTSSADAIGRVHNYYREFVAGKQGKPARNGDISIAEWIGEFKPETINIIPLFERKEDLLSCAEITKAYLADKNLEQQRVFLARSDPALNYGSLSAVLLNKIALQRLHELSKDLGTRIEPIMGAGSAPFRGNLRPETAEHLMKGYPSVQTFTIQSSFKYDHPAEEVMSAVKKIRAGSAGAPVEIGEEMALGIIEKCSREYEVQIKVLAPLINEIAMSVPERRQRKLHIGLFGYSRKMGAMQLPRAITFTAALYTLGLPPEILGLNALEDADVEFLKGAYPNFEKDLEEAVRYLNPKTLELLPEAKFDFLPSVETHAKHKSITDYVLACVKKGRLPGLEEEVVRAAKIRGFLG